MKKQIILLAILFSLTGIMAQSVKTQSLVDIDIFITDFMETNHKAGLSACIIKDDSIVWRGNYGYANIVQEKPVTQNSLFYVYSIGKSVTASSIMKLWEDGYLDLDENINNILPFQVINPNFPLTSITPRMLMCHTSGIIDDNILEHATIGDSPTSLGFFLDNFLSPGGEYYSSWNFSTYTPGTQYRYSNYGTALNGLLAESLLNQFFKNYADTSLLIPLKMINSAWMLNDIDLELLAAGYQYTGGQYVSYPNYGHPAYPGLTFKTSSEDLANYVIMLMNDGEFENTQILNQSTIDTMCVQYAYNGSSGVGLGLYKTILQYANGDKIVWGHRGGGTNGYASDFQFCPEQNIGIIYLSNSDLFASTIRDRLFEYGSLIVLPEEATDTTENSFTANWQDAPDATTYYLDVATNLSFTDFVEGYEDLDVGLVSSSSVTNLVPETNYFYRIKAHNGTELGPTSSIISLVTLEDPSGFEEMESTVKNLSCFPNPAGDAAVLSLNLPSPQSIEISIYNTTGICLKIWQFNNEPSGQREFSLDLSQLSPALYVCILKIGEERFTTKIIKK